MLLWNEYDLDHLMFPFLFKYAFVILIVIIKQIYFSNLSYFLRVLYVHTALHKCTFNKINNP